MNHWDLAALATSPRAPQILSTTDDARAIIIALEVGGKMADHQVHERAWVIVISGQIVMTATATGERVEAGPGSLFEFDPGERHDVVAPTAARLLLLLTPWPGRGHPGATPIELKQQAHDLAAAARGFAS